MNTKQKAASPWQGQNAAQHNILKPYCSDPTQSKQGLIATIKRRIWLMGYELEEARQLHAVRGHFWKEAGVCIALALLRFGRLV